ncbi:MAG: phage repressor [Anaerocolumna sp.]|nr:phage repressor [Anaerocolumna sp.]
MPDKHDMIADRLKKRRTELKLSLQDVADSTGLSKSTLQRYEMGHTDKIPLDKLESLSNALKVTPMYLMGWESKDLPYSYFKSILELVTELGYKIEYSESNEAYAVTLDDGTWFLLWGSDLKDLKDSVASFTKFKMTEIINNAKQAMRPFEEEDKK